MPSGIEPTDQKQPWEMQLPEKAWLLNNFEQTEGHEYHLSTRVNHITSETTFRNIRLTSYNGVPIRASGTQLTSKPKLNRERAKHTEAHREHAYQQEPNI